MKKYPITYWCGPPIKESTKERYKEIADAGFTLAAPPISWEGCLTENSQIDENQRILKICEALGLDVLITDKRIDAAVRGVDGWQSSLDEVVEDYRNYPALYGYYITDEPTASQFEQLGAIVSYLKDKDPDHMSYINLFPNYASSEQLGTASYEEHLERFMTQVKPELLSYDHYHFLQIEVEETEHEFADDRERQIYEAAVKRVDRAGFFDNIEAVRAAALRHDTPFMVVVLLLTHGPYRDLTEAELRWEVFQCLAYGSSAISYFTYWTPDYDEVWKPRNAVITNDGKRTEHYVEVTRINRELQILGQRLLGRKSVGVYHVGPEKERVQFFQGIEYITDISGGRVTVGVFEDGRVLLANKDYAESVELSLNIDPAYDMRVIGKQDGEEKSLGASPQASSRYRVKLEAGDAELLVFTRK